MSRWRACATFGCPEVIAVGKRYCPKHARERDRRRPSAAARGYGPRWTKEIRPAFLQAHPFCIDCGAPATVPDHSPTSRAELVRRGVVDPDAFEFLTPRCAACHSRQTATVDGGFGR